MDKISPKSKKRGCSLAEKAKAETKKEEQGKSVMGLAANLFLPLILASCLMQQYCSSSSFGPTSTSSTSSLTSPVPSLDGPAPEKIDKGSTKINTKATISNGKGGNGSKKYCVSGSGHFHSSAGVNEDCNQIEEFEDEDIDMEDFRMPSNYNFDEIVHEITTGSGYYMMKDMFSERDLEIARDRILFYENPYDHQKEFKFKQKSDTHNNYQGLLWGLLNKGKIFEKMAQHPAIVEVSKKILGENCQLSSLAANTVLPGMMNQTPHLDYPYYDFLFPNETDAMSTNHLLAVQFVTLLTDFTAENGATAIRPYSHLVPTYPKDQEEFFKHAIQISGKAGDTVVFAGPIQHCAMSNKSKLFRSGILQHMAPIYIRPFEEFHIRDEVKERASPAMRKMLALDHPYPRRKA